MSLFYLDTSTLVKRYKREKGSDVIDVLFERKSQADRVVVSFLAVIEVTGAASRLRQKGILGEEEATELLASFNRDVSEEIDLFPISESILGLAVKLANTHGLRAADSIHLAAMLELNESAKEAGIEFLAVVADRSLCDAATREGLKALNPETSGSLNQLETFIA